MHISAYPAQMWSPPVQRICKAAPTVAASKLLEHAQAVLPLSLMITAAQPLPMRMSSSLPRAGLFAPQRCLSHVCGQQHAPWHGPCPAGLTCGSLPLAGSLQHCPFPSHITMPARNRHRPQMHWQQPSLLSTVPARCRNLSHTWCAPCSFACGGAGHEGKSPVGRAGTWVHRGTSHCLPVSTNS